MNTEEQWESRFEAEIEHARQARNKKNEGMARVCARRAAGIVAAEYFKRQESSFTSQSAYALLKNLKDIEEVPIEIRKIVEHFIVRNNPDFTLPIDADLIADALWLRDNLLE